MNNPNPDQPTLAELRQEAETHLSAALAHVKSESPKAIYAAVGASARAFRALKSATSILARKGGAS